MRSRHLAIGALHTRMLLAFGLPMALAAVIALASCSSQVFTVTGARDGAATDASTDDAIGVDGDVEAIGPAGLNRLELWLRADKIPNPSLANPTVDTWRDDSPNHTDAVSAGSNPTCTSPVLIEGPKGLKALAFDGDQACLKLPPGYSDFTRGLSMFVVARTHPQVVSNTRGFLRLGAASGPAINFGKDDATILRYVASRSDGTSPNTPSRDGGVIDDAWHTYAALQEAGAGDTVAPASIWRDGAQLASNSKITAPPVAVRDQNVIGGLTTTRLKADIAEILLFSRTLPESERMAIEVYLRRKWL